MTGPVYTLPAIPPVPEHTTWVPAGTLSIGVEYRRVDDAIVDGTYDEAALEKIREMLKDKVVQDGGVSIHVSGAQDGHEYLRFDLFEREPHYHYIDPSGVRQFIVLYDRVAMGEMLPWTLHQLRHRLAPMLEHAGGAALLPKVDRAQLEAGLVKVEALVREAQRELAGGGRAD